MFQGQKEGICANEALAGNGGESGFLVQAGSYAPQSAPFLEQSRW